MGEIGVVGVEGVEGRVDDDDADIDVDDAELLEVNNSISRSRGTIGGRSATSMVYSPKQQRYMNNQSTQDRGGVTLGMILGLDSDSPGLIASP